MSWQNSVKVVADTGRNFWQRAPPPPPPLPPRKLQCDFNRNTASTAKHHVHCSWLCWFIKWRQQWFNNSAWYIYKYIISVEICMLDIQHNGNIVFGFCKFDHVDCATFVICKRSKVYRFIVCVWISNTSTHLSEQYQNVQLTSSSALFACVNLISFGQKTLKGCKTGDFGEIWGGMVTFGGKVIASLGEIITFMGSIFTLGWPIYTI